jgi:hypothetical protein
MTAAQVNEDRKAIAAYIVIAHRMANGARTDRRGRNGGRMDSRADEVVDGQAAAAATGTADRHV